MHDRIHRYLEEKISKFKTELSFCSRNRLETYGQISGVLDVENFLTVGGTPRHQGQLDF